MIITSVPNLNKRILNIKPTSEVSRKPHSIFERADYKANELRSFLLYYLRFSLPDFLRKKYIDHFQLLSSACYLLLKESISKEEVDLAEKRLIQFSNDFERLYSPSNVTLNIHLLKHIGTAVRNLGPLWAQSAFGMEANNGIINKTTAKKYPVHSIAWKYCARRANKCDKKETAKYRVGAKGTIKLSRDELEALASFGVEPKQTIYKFVMVSGNKFTSIKSKEIASIDYFVELKHGEIGQVRFYFIKDLTIYGLLETYIIIQKVDQFCIVTPACLRTVFKVSEIDKKLIYMKFGGTEVVTSLPNKYEKS